MQLRNSFVLAKADSVMCYGFRIWDWKICKHVSSECIYKSHTTVRHFSILSSCLWPRLPPRGVLTTMILDKMLYALQFSVVLAHCPPPPPIIHFDLDTHTTKVTGFRSRWSCFPRRRSAAALLLGSRVRISLRACLFVWCVFLCVG